MNYPYGENFLYTDCHPLLANAFKWLSNEFSFFNQQAVGLLNWLMIFSLFVTFIILYLLLLELQIKPYFSFLFSISIAMLAPQLFRLGGHFALSYSFAIPLSWLLTLKTLKNIKWIWYLFLFFNFMCWFFIHAYLGMICVTFCVCLVLTYFLFTKEKKLYILKHGLVLVILILSIVLFYTYTKIIDNHSSRTDNPSGFFLYNAELDDVLIPHQKPFRPLLDQLTGGIIKQEWEAWAYVGMANALFFIGLIVVLSYALFSKKGKHHFKMIFENKAINISLLAAVIVLLFAMGIPFKQFPILLDIFPVFKQFRATGRFAWPFYFAFSVFCAYQFQRIILTLSQKNKIASIVFSTVVFGLFSVEGYYYHKQVSKNISSNINLFDENKLSPAHKAALSVIHPEEYQAIISLPFFHYGSESFSRPRQDEAVKNTLTISYHTGIPTFCANLTRISIEESKRIIQILTPNFYPKAILNDIDTTKDFLLIKTGHQQTKYEQIIIDKAVSIFKCNAFEIMRIYPAALFSDDRELIFNMYKENLHTLKIQNDFYVSDSASVLYFNKYENFISDKSFKGKACYQSMKRGKNTLAEFPPHTFEKEKTYAFSVWMYNGEADALNLWFRLIIEEYDEANNVWLSTTFFPEEAEVINENWSLVEGTFKVKNPNNYVYIVTKGKKDDKASLYVDDLLITEKDIDVYKFYPSDSNLFFNNHHITKQ